MTPSLPALRAFDAAARLGRFRSAAEELRVTPTAISHHIRGLEDQLGVQLFTRSGRDVVLTEDGKRLAEATAKAFGTLDDAVRSLQRRSRKVVRLSAGPIFTARWLMPRISDFWETHPETELEVLPSFHPGSGDPENVDIVIRWGRMSEITNNATKLLELSPVAIASHSFLEAFGAIHAPKDLLELPLLHQRNHWGWLDWFAAMNVPITDPLRGSVFEDANVLLRGASQGQGAVIGWLPLIDQDLSEGRVIRLFDETIAATHSYFIEVRGNSSARREVQQLLDWLLSEAGQRTS